GVVVGEPRHVVVERVFAGGGQQAGLSHGTSGNLAPATRALDERRAAGEHRTDRRTQALGETYRDAVEMTRDLARRHMRGDRGVEQAGTVQVQCESFLAGEVAGAVEAAQRQGA